ncbi:hypothetical protein Tco_0197289 [Tanacetum coccineum]
MVNRRRTTDQRWSTTVVNGGQQRSTPPDHRRTTGQRWRSTKFNGGGPSLTTAGPPPDHRSTVVDGKSIGGPGRVLGRVWTGIGPGMVGSWAGSGSGIGPGLVGSWAGSWVESGRVENKPSQESNSRPLGVKLCTHSLPLC